MIFGGIVLQWLETGDISKVDKPELSEALMELIE
jgi:hypothetical protein